MNAWLPCLLTLVACGAAEPTSAGPGAEAIGASSGEAPATGSSGVAGSGGEAGSGSSGSPSGSSSSGAAPAVTCGTTARRAPARTLHVGAVDRTAIAHVPANLDPSAPAPLVIVHHGYTMSAETMRRVTRYEELADQEGFVVVFPDGEGGPDSLDAPWNVGQDVCPSEYGDVPVATGDDFGLLDAIKANVAEEQCLDSAHFYVSGFSMGGYFAHHTGCMRDDVRAVAPHSGGTHALDACPVAHKPVFIVHGDADDVIPAGCDDPAAPAVKGFQPSAAAWAEHNGCGTTTHAVSVLQGSCTSYDGCPADGQVTVCTMHGMGHCWAGGAKESTANGCPGWADATTLEWQFFRDHAW